MKKIKCISLGNFNNLTVNKEYEVILESTDLFTILNDIEVEARYHKKYFEEVKLTPPQKIKPIFTAVKDDNFNISLTIEYGVENNTTTSTRALIFHEIAGNCGTASYDGINSICNILNNHDELTAENIKTAIDTILAVSSKAFTVFSTNKEYPLLWDVLDEMCNFCSEERVNSNSDNPIKIWGFYTT